MNRDLWTVLDRVRGLPIPGGNELAEALQNEGVRFSTRDVGVWSQFLSRILGPSPGTLPLPVWLATVVAKIASASAPVTACDPCAGIGLLLGVLNEACAPTVAVAISQDRGEAAIGGAIMPELDWQGGDPLKLLEATTAKYDLVASILPMGGDHCRSGVVRRFL